jgi:hypothetical protein
MTTTATRPRNANATAREDEDDGDEHDDDDDDEEASPAPIAAMQIAVAAAAAAAAADRNRFLLGRLGTRRGPSIAMASRFLIVDDTDDTRASLFPRSSGAAITILYTYYRTTR